MPTESLCGSFVENWLAREEQNELIHVRVFLLNKVLPIDVGDVGGGIPTVEIIAKLHELSVERWFEVPALNEGRLAH